jgi:hypothetical protein
MSESDSDDLVQFHDVRVIRSTPPALLCGIGSKRVWLPRRHISGRLWRTGDRGRLLVRGWVARDRHLIAPRGADALSPPSGPATVRRGRRGQLHLVRTQR